MVKPGTLESKGMVIDNREELKSGEVLLVMQKREGRGCVRDVYVQERKRA